MNRLKVLFLVNPLSGARDKSGIVSLVEEKMDRSKYDVRIRYTEYAGHATLLSGQSSADIVVAVGGDGTVSEVAQGLAGSDKALGIIPCGSGDGLALHLGISRDPLKAIQTLNCHEVRRIDYATVNGKSFFCTCGVGFDADVAQAFASSGKRGLSTYITTALKLWRGYHPSSYRITLDGKEISRDAVLITVGNASQWGNNAWITPRASVRDGLLDVTVVAPFSSFAIPRLATALLTRRADRTRGVETFRAKSITIERPTEGAFHYDGDPSRGGTTLKIDIHPCSLNVVVPIDKADRI